MIAAVALGISAALTAVWGGEYSTIVALAVAAVMTAAWARAIETRVPRCATGCERCGLPAAAPPIAWVERWESRHLERWEARMREQLRAELKSSIVTRMR